MARMVAEQQLQLDSILITHHHADHIGGVTELLERFRPQVYAPAMGRFNFPHQAVNEGDRIPLPDLGIQFKVLAIPGHTLDHVAYYGGNRLFCGDTLFGCGCGRLFEGDFVQLYGSLQKLAALPCETLIYCAHEYTLDNIRFARSIDPANTALQRREQDATRLRASDHPTLPSRLDLELATNPFLRCHTAAVQAAAQRHANDACVEPAAVFAQIREIKNSF